MLVFSPINLIFIIQLLFLEILTQGFLMIVIIFSIKIVGQFFLGRSLEYDDKISILILEGHTLSILLSDCFSGKLKNPCTNVRFLEIVCFFFTPLFFPTTVSGWKLMTFFRSNGKNRGSI